jgi:hypothetical protein
MNPLRRIAFGNWCWTIPWWLCIAVPGMAQVNQVDRAQLFRANAPPGPLVPSALSTEEQEYAPYSENNADLGTQRILQKIEEHKAWTVQLGLPIYYTSNVALVRNGEQSDAVFTPGMGVTYQPRITKTLYGEFSLPLGVTRVVVRRFHNNLNQFGLAPFARARHCAKETNHKVNRSRIQ